MKKNKALFEYGKYLNKWLNDLLLKTNKSGYVIGISGGIDSALCLAICLSFKKIKTYPIFLDINNSQLDKKCVNELSKSFGISIKHVDLKQQAISIKKLLGVKDRLTLANINPRLRMLSLYALAQENNMLVLGTSNMDELYLGYFTKYGDGASDVQILNTLTKKDIKELSIHLKVPQIIIDREPSASLFEDQTDEKELGISYDSIDTFLLGKGVPNKEKIIITNLHKKNTHKSLPIITPKAYRIYKSK